MTKSQKWCASTSGDHQCCGQSDENAARRFAQYTSPLSRMMDHGIYPRSYSTIVSSTLGTMTEEGQISGTYSLWKKETFGYLPHRPSTVLIQPLPLTKCLATSGTHQSVFSFEPKGFPTRRRKLKGRKVSISVSRVSHRQACAKRDKHTKIFVHEAKPRRMCTPDILQCASGSASFGPSLNTFYTKCDT